MSSGFSESCGNGTRVGAQWTASMRPKERTAMTSAGATKRAVLYARVSSKDQEREGFSIPAQLKLLRQYAREQGLTIVQEFVDVETAKQAGRGRFGEMLTLLQADPSCRTVL